MKFGQLIEYNMKNVFVWKTYENHTQNVMKKVFPDLFLKT